MSNFAAIGLCADDPDDMERVVAMAVESARPHADIGRPDDRHLWWQDASGAALAVHQERSGDVACVTPFFVAPHGGATWRVRTGSAHVDKECVHCSGADCDVLDSAGELVTRATVQWLLFEPYRAWLSETREYELEIVAFATSLALCATEAELEAAQASLFGERDPAAPDEPGKPMRLADKAFLPYGMFENAGHVTQRARVILTGTVEALSTPVNGLTGSRFVHARVATLGGSIDLVAPREAYGQTASTPRLALADVWLVGRPREAPPPAASRGWFKKLLSGS